MIVTDLQKILCEICGKFFMADLRKFFYNAPFPPLTSYYAGIMESTVIWSTPQNPHNPISLASEIMERALVAERRALMFVLPFHAVGVYIAVNRERDAILDPCLTEHLFGD